MMKCPFCPSIESKVVDKRSTSDLSSTRRRRECLSCSKRYTTYERVEIADLNVVKKNNNREQFSRDKLRNGISMACRKRPISQELVEETIDQIEADLRSKETNEISSKIIGDLVMKKLKKLDKIAYIRFASVYRDFADLESFEKEVDKLKK